MTANMKMIISAYLSENDPIMTQFGTLNEVVTTIKMIYLKFKLLNLRWRIDTILQNVIFGRNLAAYCQKA